MQQLIYISTATATIGAAELGAILAASRRNNRRDDISGLLLHDGRRFLQVLEGAAPLVDAAFLRIKADPRHRAAVMLSSSVVGARSFGRWHMACETVAPAADGASLADTVAGLVQGSQDRNLRALFTSFAKIQRAA